MRIGKVSNEDLKEIILSKLKKHSNDILIRPKIGEDCCAVDFGNYACVLSSDPITGAINEIGRLAVHITCNDVASCGVQPLAMLVTILAPPDTTKQDLKTVIKQLTETADSLHVEIIGGHTEITAAVNRMVITSTAIGKILKENLISTSGAKPGENIILTKSAGIEGTSILAHDCEQVLLKVFKKDFVERAKSFINIISVVNEGIIAGEFGASSMHDVTEGGILGAVWEVSEASGVGVKIYKDRIPVEPETAGITAYFGIDPYKLISSGCMIITCKDGELLVHKLKMNGIPAAIIGETTEGTEKLFIGENTEDILQPDSDELYKVIR